MLATAFRVATRIANPALLTYGAITGTRERVEKGQNPAFAAAMEAGTVALGLLLNPVAQIGLFVGVPLGRAAASAVIGQVKEHNNMMRLSRTPFSHRFEHSDVSARAQALGLQQIGAAWGHARMASEASMMAKRYLR